MPEGGASGVIIAQGGAFGGWSLYAKDGTPGLLLQPASGCSGSRSTATQPLPAGEHQVRMEFAYDGGGLGKGGDGDALRRRQPGRRGPGRGHRADGLLGRRDDRRRRRHRHAGQRRLRTADSAFTGRVRWVQIDLDEAAEDADHLITPEERLRVAMARQ